MNIDRELIDVEDFEQAYHSRLQDLIKLKTNVDPRKVFSMHLGGIIIECMLKKLIIEKKNITKMRYCNKRQWFTQDVFEHLKSQGNVSKTEFREACIENPDHDLMAALDLLEELYSNMPDDIINRIKKLHNPLQTDYCDYIDLRYIAEENFNEEFFIEWKEDFKIVLNWITEHAHLVNGGRA